MHTDFTLYSLHTLWIMYILHKNRTMMIIKVVHYETELTTILDFLTKNRLPQWTVKEVAFSLLLVSWIVSGITQKKLPKGLGKKTRWKGGTWSTEETTRLW